MKLIVHCFKKISKITKKYCNGESSELLNFFNKTYKKFCIFQKLLLFTEYSIFLIENFKEDSQLQAKITGYLVKN
jgi:hypothetical protein